MNDDELERELREREKLYRSSTNDEPENRRIDGEQKRLALEAYFRELVSSYVNFPDNLKIELKKPRRGYALMIEPDVCDYGIVAGKLGRNYNALEVLATGIGENVKEEIQLLLEGPPVDDTKHIRKQLPYKVNPQWTPALIKELMVRTLRLAGMEHIQVRLQKNTVISETNPFNDQTYYWFFGMNTDKEALFVLALGQLMESVGTAQGQRLMPKFKPEMTLFEKTA